MALNVNKYFLMTIILLYEFEGCSLSNDHHRQNLSKEKIMVEICRQVCLTTFNYLKYLIKTELA